MKKFLLAAILILFSSDILAQWKEIGKSAEKGGYTVYVDAASMRKAVNRVKMWILFDYVIEQKASGVVFLSQKIRREYDCGEMQMRTLAYALFSWNLEKGDQIRAYNQPQIWKKVVPETMDEVEWKAACHS